MFLLLLKVGRPAVPVPGVVILKNPSQVQEHYRFPVTPANEGTPSSPDVVGRSRQSSATRVIRHPQQQQQQPPAARLLVTYSLSLNTRQPQPKILTM